MLVCLRLDDLASCLHGQGSSPSSPAAESSVAGGGVAGGGGGAPGAPPVVANKAYPASVASHLFNPHFLQYAVKDLDDRAGPVVFSAPPDLVFTDALEEQVRVCVHGLFVCGMFVCGLESSRGTRPSLGFTSLPPLPSHRYHVLPAYALANQERGPGLGLVPGVWGFNLRCHSMPKIPCPTQVTPLCAPTPDFLPRP